MKALLKKIMIGLILIFIVSEVYAQRQIKNKQHNQPVLVNQKMPDSLQDFKFKDSLDRNVSISDFRGKYLVLDLWYSGCGACIHVNEGLRKVHDRLKDKNIVFISISIDKTKEMWMLGITKDTKPSRINNWAGRYWPAPGTVCLYTGGSGSANSFINKYVPDNAYPELILVDPEGIVIANTLPRPDDDPNLLINYLEQFL